MLDESRAVRPRQFVSPRQFLTSIKIQVLAFRPSPRNSRIGFVDLLFSQISLKVCGFGLHSRDGRIWLSLPARPRDYDVQTRPVFYFLDAQIRAAFEEAALRAIDASPLVVLSAGAEESVR
jgi:hypothetical protein